MKAFILVICSFAILVGCSTTKDPGKASANNRLPPAATGFCNANNGVLVILLSTDGVNKLPKDPNDKNSPLVAKGFACPTLGAGGPGITQPDDLPSGLEDKGLVDLGEIRKYSNSDDPCYEWIIDGNTYHVCWPPLP